MKRLLLAFLFAGYSHADDMALRIDLQHSTNGIYWVNSGAAATWYFASGDRQYFKCYATQVTNKPPTGYSDYSVTVLSSDNHNCGFTNCKNFAWIAVPTNGGCIHVRPAMTLFKR